MMTPEQRKAFLRLLAPLSAKREAEIDAAYERMATAVGIIGSPLSSEDIAAAWQRFVVE